MADKEHVAARTGLGAVMGSKNLKAIAVHPSRDFPYQNEADFKALVAELHRGPGFWAGQRQFADIADDLKQHDIGIS